MGVVVGSRGNDLMRPEVLLQIDRLGRKAEEMTIIDLSQMDNLFIQRSLHDVGKLSV